MRIQQTEITDADTCGFLIPMFRISWQKMDAMAFFHGISRRGMDASKRFGMTPTVLKIAPSAPQEKVYWGGLRPIRNAWNSTMKTNIRRILENAFLQESKSAF